MWRRCTLTNLQMGWPGAYVKNPSLLISTRGFDGVSGVDLLSRAVSSLSLARRCFTVLFGMGRGGTSGLWTPDVTCMLAGRQAQNGEGCGCDCYELL